MTAPVITYNAPAPSLADVALYNKYKEAKERNRNRALMELGVQEPTTAQRRLGWRTFGNELRNTVLTGLLAGGATGLSGHGGQAPLIGAGLGAGAYLLVAGLLSAAGSIHGSVGKLSPEIVKGTYEGRHVANAYSSAYAQAQLDKIVQERQSRHQAEAPTQLA